jgi:adhesin transport system outer membrane protein
MKPLVKPWPRRSAPWLLASVWASVLPALAQTDATSQPTVPVAQSSTATAGGGMTELEMAAFGGPAMGPKGWLEPAVGLKDFQERLPVLTPEFVQRIRAAVDAHPSNQSASFRSGEADAALGQTASSIYPQVSAEVGPKANVGTRSALNQIYPQGTRVDAMVSVSQLLFDFGAAFNRIDAASSRLEAQKASQRAQRSALTLRAVSTWLEVIRARRQLALAQGFDRKITEIAAAVEARTQAGRSPGADALRANSRVADVRARIQEAQGRLRQMEAVYREVFGETPAELLSLPAAAPLGTFSSEELKERAKTRNAEIERQSQMVNSARQSSQAARGDLWPKLFLNVSTNRVDINGPSTNPKLVDNVVNFSVKFPILDGGLARAVAREGVQREQRERADYDMLVRETSRVIDTTVGDIQAKTARGEALNQAVQANAQAELDHTEQFRFGRRLLIELLDTERELYLSASQLLDNQVDLEIAKYSLSAAAGEILEYFKN